MDFKLKKIQNGQNMPELFDNDDVSYKINHVVFIYISFFHIYF